MTLFASSAGVKLAYDVAGSGHPALLFVHGWCCDRSYFDPQVRHFVQDHAVATVDLRGHGDSSRPDPSEAAYDIETLAGDVIAASDAAGFRKPVLVGHSLGALVGLACAALGRVSAVVMLDPAPITNEAAKKFFLESVSAVAGDADGSWRARFAHGMFLPTDRARRAAIIGQMPAGDAAIAAALMRAMGEFDGPGTLARARVPVLSIGSDGPSNSPADLREACADITIGQTVGSGHFIQLEVPDQVNAMIERFLAIFDL